MASTLVKTCLAGLVPAYILFLWARKPARPAPYPPGPRRLPVIGNLLDLPMKHMWLTAKDWAAKYGDITYLNVFGLSLVFLNSPDVASDLLDRRGAVYSDKPYLTMAGELCGCDNMVAFSHYGDQSRRQRRLMNRAFGLAKVRAYDPLAALEARAFLARLVAGSASDPAAWVAGARRYGGALTLLVVYGYRVRADDDKFLEQADAAVELLSNKIASAASVWMVDVFPSLKHLPAWLPGAGFKRKAAVWKRAMEDFVEAPYAYMKREVAAGTAVPSFCSTILDHDGVAMPETDEFDLKWTANSMYAASLDTSITTIAHFILAMLQYPATMRRAQAELDAVLRDGTDGALRLPTHDDRARLPYLDALFSEVLRWAAPVPINLPHRLMEDDVYKGMFIPKGSFVFGNIWSMVRDETLYPNADVFQPERFLAPASPSAEPDADDARRERMDPRNYVFGFGRRRCPGAHLIERALWLLMASMLATLDIAPAVDEHGSPVPPVVRFDNAVFRMPAPFGASFKPRSDAAAKLIAEGGLLA